MTSSPESLLTALPWVAVIGACLVATVTDLKSRRIPNALTFPLFFAGLVYAFTTHGWMGGLNALGACLALALPFIVLFACAGGGAGDAKLMGAIGCWLGLETGLSLLVAVCLTGVVMALIWATVKGHLRPVMNTLSNASIGLLGPLTATGRLRDVPAFMPAAEAGLPMPYGPAILVGTLLTALGVLPWM